MTEKAMLALRARLALPHCWTILRDMARPLCIEFPGTLYQITYHPQSGWFEDTPLKGGTEEGCPLKGVHEGTFLIEAGHPAWNHSRASGLTVVLRLGLLYGLGSGLSHKTSSAPPQRRNGRACSSLTARGGGLPVGVKPCKGRLHKCLPGVVISR